MADLRQKLCLLLAVACIVAASQAAFAQESRRSRRGPTSQPPAAAASARATEDATGSRAGSQPEASSADADKSNDDDLPPRPDQAARPFTPITAYVNARVMTQDSPGTIEQAVVLVQDGKIYAVGDSSTPIPARATRVDLVGHVLTPGLIDASSRLWLSSDSISAAASDASLDMVDGLDPFAEDWHEVVRHGVTSVYVQPSSSGVMGGFGAVLSVAPSSDQPVVHRRLVALQASFGNSANNRSRSQQLDRIKRMLDNAAEYAKKWKEYNDYVAQQEAEKAKQSEKPKEGEAADGKKPDGESGSAKTPPASGPADVAKPETQPEQKPDAQPEQKPDAKAEQKPDAKPEEKKPPKKPDVDAVLENLVKVLGGEIPIHFDIQNADDVAYLDKLLSDEKYNKLQVVMSGLTDLRSGLQSVVDSNRPLVLGPWLQADGASSRLEPPTISTWGKQFATYPGTLAIVSNGRSIRSSRLLRAHAAMAIAQGFAADRALSAVTNEAARLLGVDKDLGSISVGKRADLVAFTDAPFAAGSQVRMVVVGGETVYDSGNADKFAGDAVVASTSDSGALELPARLPSAFRLRSSRVFVDGKLQPLTVTVEDGKVVGVAAGDASTDTASTDAGLPLLIDCSNAVITPGLFSAHAQLGVNRLVDPQGLPDASFVVAADCLINEHTERQRLLRSGLIAVALSPGNANPIAGTVSIVKLAGAEPVLQREAALKLVMSASSRSPDSYPSSLGGQLQLLQQSLAGTLLDSRLYVPERVDSALNERRLAALQATAGGDKRLAIIAVQTDAEIRGALDLIERFKLRAALLGPRQLKPFIERIKELKVGVILESSEPTTYAWFYDDVRSAAEAGIAIAFAGESGEELRTLAALSQLPNEIALKALFGPADDWNLAPLGIRADAPADMVIWSDSPVGLSATPLCVVVDGKVVHQQMPSGQSSK